MAGTGLEQRQDEHPAAALLEFGLTYKVVFVSNFFDYLHKIAPGTKQSARSQN